MLPKSLLLIALAAMATACERVEKDAAAEPTTPAVSLIPGTPEGDLGDWVQNIVDGTARLPEEAKSDAASAQRKALDLYVSRQEYIEMYYGPGGKLSASAELGAAIESAEARFHELMQLLGAKPVDIAAVEKATTALHEQEKQVSSLWRAGKARLDRSAVAATTTAGIVGRTRKVDSSELKTDEIRGVVTSFNSAAEAYAAGNSELARTLILNTYLEQFEPIESRLPSSITNKVENLIHVQIRPAIERGENTERVTNLINAANTALIPGDAHLARGASFWFASVNAFVIILREGLEAVLLVAALLGYLAAIGASRRHRTQIYTGVGAGIVASFITWGAARTLIPIDGANRELIEGITALVAVGVLLYVSNWLFQKTYIHDWKKYLREKLNNAVSSKSAFAMMLLAFAAVYREGFETVLFYQALIFDSSAVAVFTGFVPGIILIGGIGVLIIRAGAKLPLKQMFAVTNSILVYLAFVFVGKGLYNLHEAGVFAARQLPLPDVQALRLIFGWYPLLETTVAQALYLTLIAATFVFYKRRLAVSDPARAKIAA
jgi:high-affinity iron transporter